MRAGLSSADLTAEQKKAYYGLAYLLVDRIAQRDLGVSTDKDMTIKIAKAVREYVTEKREQLPGGVEVDADGVDDRGLFGPTELAVVDARR